MNKFIKRIIGLFKPDTKFQTIPEMLSSNEMFQDVLKSPYSYSDKGIPVVEKDGKSSIKVDLDNPDGQSKGYSTKEIFSEQEVSYNPQPVKVRKKPVAVENIDWDETFNNVKSLMEKGIPKYIACKNLGMSKTTFDKYLSVEQRHVLDEISYSFSLGTSFLNPRIKKSRKKALKTN